MLAKFLLGLAIIAFTTYCGYLLSNKYRKRKVFFIVFFDFNERFLSEISYLKRPLVQWISSFSQDGDFGVLLSIFLNEIVNGGELTETDLSIEQFSYLTKEEKNEILQYFSMLGKGDSLSQKAYFSTIKESVKKHRDNAENTAKKYVDLYIKLGFLCGLLILILIL